MTHAVATINKYVSAAGCVEINRENRTILWENDILFSHKRGESEHKHRVR